MYHLNVVHIYVSLRGSNTECEGEGGPSPSSLNATTETVYVTPGVPRYW